MSEEVDLELVAALAVTVLHLRQKGAISNAGRMISSVWTDDHRRRMMGSLGIQEHKQSRTSWR